MESKSLSGVTSTCSTQCTTGDNISESAAITPEVQNQVPGEIEAFPYFGFCVYMFLSTVTKTLDVMQFFGERNCGSCIPHTC